MHSASLICCTLSKVVKIIIVIISLTISSKCCQCNCSCEVMSIPEQDQARAMLFVKKTTATSSVELLAIGCIMMVLPAHLIPIGLHTASPIVQIASTALDLVTVFERVNSNYFSIHLKLIFSFSILAFLWCKVFE